MIRIRRAPLSAELTGRLERRTQALGGTPAPAAAREAWNGARAVKDELKSALVKLAHRAPYCMYCLDSLGTDVDHYRPLLTAPHLAFDWGNHLLACGHCNQIAKREQFPLNAKGDPLLLDPTRDDSGEHLTVAGSGHFISLTDRGQATIDVLRLNEYATISGARAEVLLLVQEMLRRNQNASQNLSRYDGDMLKALSHVTVLHLFAHAVGRGDLRRIPRTRDLSDYATRQLPVFRKMFPLCSF